MWRAVACGVLMGGSLGVGLAVGIESVFSAAERVAAAAESERAIAARLAAKYGAEAEVALWDRTRVDLLSAELAIEVDGVRIGSRRLSGLRRRAAAVCRLLIGGICRALSMRSRWRAGSIVA